MRRRVPSIRKFFSNGWLKVIPTLPREVSERFVVKVETDSVTLAAMSRSIGFPVTAQNSYSARQIVEKEHSIFIFIDDKSFVRGSGSSMVASGSSFLQSIKRKAKRCKLRMETALAQNLTRDEHLVAAETLSRASIIASTAAAVRVKTNRAAPDAGQKADPFDTASALRGAR